MRNGKNFLRPQHIVNRFLQVFRIGVLHMPGSDDVHFSDKLEYPGVECSGDEYLQEAIDDVLGT